MWGGVTGGMGSVTDPRRYSIIPIRSLGIVKNGEDWRVLAALGAHASRRGIVYAKQSTLGALINMDQPHVSRALRRLWEHEPVRMLEPKGKKHRLGFQRGNRMQLLYDGPGHLTPLPSAKELELPWGTRNRRWP